MPDWTIEDKEQDSLKSLYAAGEQYKDVTKKLEEYEQLQWKSRKVIAELDERNTIIAKQNEELIQKRNEVSTEQVLARESLRKANMMQDAFLKFGKHTDECNYIDAISIGRAELGKKTEGELCTCGYSKIKQSILITELEEPEDDL